MVVLKQKRLHRTDIFKRVQSYWNGYLYTAFWEQQCLAL